MWLHIDAWNVSTVFVEYAWVWQEFVVIVPHVFGLEVDAKDVQHGRGRL